jgi:hypothetical protein
MGVPAEVKPTGRHELHARNHIPNVCHRSSPIAGTQSLTFARYWSKCLLASARHTNVHWKRVVPEHGLSVAISLWCDASGKTAVDVESDRRGITGFTQESVDDVDRELDATARRNPERGRPGQLEPRAIKRQKKEFHYMTAPRAELKAQLRAKHCDTA